jgi:hypothetical protein
MKYFDRNYRRVQEMSREDERYDNFAAELDKQADEHLSRLITLCHELRGFQFGGILMIFKDGNLCLPSYDTASVGSFEFKQLRVPSLLESYFMEISISMGMIFL